MNSMKPSMLDRWLKDGIGHEAMCGMHKPMSTITDAIPLNIARFAFPSSHGHGPCENPIF